MSGRLAVGLMSGTSADGASLALVSISGRKVRVLAERTFPYSRRLQTAILNAGRLSVPELSRLNFELGALFGRAAVRFLRQNRVPLRSVRAIGSHGQTVYHGPGDRERNTLQIGEAALIAEATGIPVVADFRPGDIAAGGCGAPLVPYLDEFLFSRGPVRALQNIGGIANVSVVGGGAAPLGFDTGPGNCLIDAEVQRTSGGRKRFDKNGFLAKRGKIDYSLANRMLRDPFFTRRPPKSLDRSAFLDPFFKKFSGPLKRRRLEDRVATLTYFTALSIFKAYERFVFPHHPVKEVVISGGGARNPALVRHLKEAFYSGPMKNIRVRFMDEFGISSTAKEAACFALMADRALQGKTNHCPEATGARGRRILGKIIDCGRAQN
ncbi:MAG: anhydro-N-acetylmuramic acid kinase [Elusimicrobia bacterium RIFCSPLOWO2_12_FULL_59_9]|nr:MAG: anhydro-N-acetylmuramic acid kinase [Elusimicrobia bacterium RIFCSPLOWO2_12_FULL_59_9]